MAHDWFKESHEAWCREHNLPAPKWDAITERFVNTPVESKHETKTETKNHMCSKCGHVEHKEE